MDRVESLRKRLANANISRVAERCGLSRPTLIAIRDGETLNPGILTVESIEKALDELDPVQAAG